MKFVSAQAATAAKEKEAERKLAQKQKDAWAAILNMVTVPLAKFETDLAHFSSGCPGHQMLASLNTLFATGNEIKQEAQKGMEETSDGASKEKAKAWIEHERANSKAMQALSTKKK